MALTAADLQPGLASYSSDRGLYDVLFGIDETEPFLDAVHAGDTAKVKTLLAQVQWSKLMLEERHVILDEVRPSKGPDDPRQVSAEPLLILARTITIAAVENQADVLTVLLNFAVQYGQSTSKVITREAIKWSVQSDSAAAFEVVATVPPDLVNYDLAHSTRPLYEAVRYNAINLIRTLLELGADLQHPAGPQAELHPYRSALLAKAAGCEGPRMVQLLLKHGVAIQGSAALHYAAAHGKLDTVRVLVDHGADIDEKIPTWSGWTPMHFAVWMSCAEGVKLLRELGARDLEDDEGKKPDQIETLQQKREATTRADVVGTA